MVYWLWETARVRKVVGSNPCAIYWMDLTFFCGKNCCLFEKTEINEKEAEVGPFKKPVKWSGMTAR